MMARKNITDINIYSSCSLSLSLSLCPRVNEATDRLDDFKLHYVLSENEPPRGQFDRQNRKPAALGDTPRVGGMLPF